MKTHIEVWEGPQLSSEGPAGILGGPWEVLRGQAAMDSVEYGCPRGVSGGCLSMFLTPFFSVS